MNLKLGFLKKDMVFTISLILALISCLFHAPKMEYINFEVLIGLFNLMIVVKAFEELKLLDKVAISMLSKCRNSKSLSAVLIFLCFFSSMLLTTPTQQATGVLYSEFLLIVHEVSSLLGKKLRFGKNNTLYYSVHSLRPELGTDKEY